MDSSKPPGSLLLAWQVKDRHCLVIGAGEVALSRVDHLIRANAKITVISGAKLHPGIAQHNSDKLLYNLVERDFQPADLHMYEKSPPFSVPSFADIDPAHYPDIDDLVFNQHFACVNCCIDDPELSTKIYYMCKYLRIPVNIADKPPMCDFYFGAMFNQDALQIMISTNGKSPRLLKMIKDDICKKFSNLRLNNAVDNLGAIRARLREKHVTGSDLDSIDSRMQWIKALTDFFTLEEWVNLHLLDLAVDRIVDTYPGFPPKDYQEFKDFLCAEACADKESATSEKTPLKEVPQKDTSPDRDAVEPESGNARA